MPLSEGNINSAIEQGKIFGEGDYLESKTVKNIIDVVQSAHRNSKEKQLGPETEIVRKNESIHIGDTRTFNEEYIAQMIVQQWGETLDTLVPIKVTKLEGNENLIITETWTTNNKPYGTEDVLYQFSRRGRYGKDSDGDEFDITDTTISKFVIVKDSDGNDNDRGILEKVGPDVPMLRFSENKPNLEPNQFKDGSNIVTEYKILI